jgi:hypothetical protein
MAFLSDTLTKITEGIAVLAFERSMLWVFSPGFLRPAENVVFDRGGMRG